MAELIEQVAARQPLVLVLEDLHWADEMSLRLLAFVSRRIPAWTALLVTTARDEELADASMARRTLEELTRAPQATPVALSPLSRADTALLVRALTRVGSDAPTVAQVEEQIWAMSEGNPFVAVEAMRALDQTTLWEDAHGASGAPTLPASVRDLVARRLDRLSARGQQLAAVAAVIGRRFDFTLLRIRQRAWTNATRRRRSRRWSATTCSRPWGTSWTSPTIGSARSRMAGCSPRADGSSIAPWPRRSRRGRGNRRDGRAPRDRLDEQIEQLAHHAASRANCARRPCDYLRQAGEKAAARSALPDARAWFEQALGALEALPESRSRWRRPSRSASRCDRC